MMKKNVLEYKAYHTVIEFDSETNTLRGKIEGINDYVDFSSTDATTFNVRIQPLLHKKLVVFAVKNGETLNSVVGKAIENYIG